MNKFFCTLLWCIVWTVSLLPLKFFYILSDIVAFLLHYIIRYRSTTIDINLARSFPHLKYNDFKPIKKEYYKYMCDIIFESIWAVTATEKQICKVVKPINIQVIDNVCQNNNKVITIMGHCGNWEMVGGMCGEKIKRSKESFANNNIVLTYKAAQNKTFDMLFRKLRMNEYEKFGNNGELIESKRILRHVIQDKLKKCTYMFIADQSPIHGERIPVKFLNQPSIFMCGPEYVAVKMNLPVLYLGMNRIKRGEYEIKFSIITLNAAETEKGFVTREYARFLENDIFTNKSNWLWSHKRWKRDFTPEEAKEYESIYGAKNNKC